MSTTTDRTEELAEAALVDASSHAAGSNAGGTTAAAAAAKSAGPGIVPALSWPLRLLCLAGAVALAGTITLAVGVLAGVPA